MEDVLRIEASRRADAECIADALAEYEARTESEGDNWVVVVDSVSSGRMLAAVLDARRERDRGGAPPRATRTRRGRLSVADARRFFNRRARSMAAMRLVAHRRVLRDSY